MNPVAIVRSVLDTDGQTYAALMFICPGCAGDKGGSGLHMLPVNSPSKNPSWDWDGNLEAPTLSPSILTRMNYYTGPDTPTRPFVCHSFLRNGIFEYLTDSTHALAGQSAPLPPLEDWMLKE